MFRTSLALALLLATAGIGQAQQEVEWKQTLSTPKGISMPRDRADILGIELGDSYEEAKVKLLKLFDEGIQKKPSTEEPKQPTRPRTVYDPLPDTPPPIIPVAEEKNIFRFQPPGSQLMWTATYVAKLTMKRQQKGVTDRAVDDEVTVVLSSPASGHQVLGIERRLAYYVPGDQPRVSDIITQLIAKMKAQPHITLQGSTGYYKFQFDDGKSVPFDNAPSGCGASHRTSNANEVDKINRRGDCDAIFSMQVEFGISRDHAKEISFVLSDNARAKANLGADFAFVRDYIRGLGERTRPAPPKL